MVGNANWDKNLFAYCDNNPVNRKDDGGQCWNVVIGFAFGIAGQYVSDVIKNVKEGETGWSVFAPTSSKKDYLASGVGGAIAAFPLGGLLGTVAFGAVGNVTSDWIKGNLHSADDIKKSALRGGISNALGYGAAKGIAALKVKQIQSLPRSSRKVILRDEVFFNGQSAVNQNLRTFANSSFTANVKLIEKSYLGLRSGVYSTGVSTISLLL